MFLACADSRFEGESTLPPQAGNASRWAQASKKRIMSMTFTQSDKPQEKTIELKKRIGLLITAYGITLLLLIRYVEGFVLFPGGLFYFFAFENINFFILVGIGWIFYLAISLSIILTKHKRAYQEKQSNPISGNQQAYSLF
jgi:hypothetical protein